ncbi:MAG TPA: DUF2608 domain-containing protein [Parachlamydiaceae bacterium]|nr:DUF2608 domain-containing protein [Parachlamydiaceae bacterium]
MKKICSTIILTLLVLTCHAQITQVNTMQEVFEYFNDADAKTLAIFDVDLVLVQPSDPAFQMANILRFSTVAKRILKSLSPEKQMMFYSLTTIDSEPILTEECIPRLFKQLMDKRIPTMALTANLTGTLGQISNMLQWRISSLCSLGIDFAKSAPYHAPLTFNDLACFRGNNSQYMNGVFCVNGTVVSKGEAFLAFIDKTKLSPEKVIFIDDRKENLISVETALQKLDKRIEFYGLHYTGAQKYPSKMISEEEFEVSWEKLAMEALKLE